MKHLKNHNELGFAHVLIILAIVFTVGGVGATTYYQYQKRANDKATSEQKARSAEQAQLAKEAAAKKELEDKKLSELAAKQAESVAKPQPAPECTRDTKMYVSVTEGHSLRVSPSLDAARSVTAPYRAALKVGCKQGDWYSAEYNGQVAFAYAAYLSAAQPAAPTVPKPVTVTGNMTQDKCLSVDTLYVVKEGAPVYKWSEEGKVVSAGITAAKGTAISGGECTMWAGNVVPGYWERDAKLYSFSYLSTTKP